MKTKKTMTNSSRKTKVTKTKRWRVYRITNTKVKDHIYNTNLDMSFMRTNATISLLRTKCFPKNEGFQIRLSSIAEYLKAKYPNDLPSSVL